MQVLCASESSFTIVRLATIDSCPLRAFDVELVAVHDPDAVETPVRRIGMGTPPSERITNEGSTDRKSFTDHVNHAFQFFVMALQRFVRLIDSWASRLAIERRTQQDLCPARRSTFSLSLYTEPERAVALFIDDAHKVACSWRKQGGLSAGSEKSHAASIEQCISTGSSTTSPVRIVFASGGIPEQVGRHCHAHGRFASNDGCGVTGRQSSCPGISKHQETSDHG